MEWGVGRGREGVLYEKNRKWRDRNECRMMNDAMLSKGWYVVGSVGRMRELDEDEGNEKWRGRKRMGEEGCGKEVRKWERMQMNDNKEAKRMRKMQCRENENGWKRRKEVKEKLARRAVVILVCWCCCTEVAIVSRRRRRKRRKGDATIGNNSSLRESKDSIRERTSIALGGKYDPSSHHIRSKSMVIFWLSRGHLDRNGQILGYSHHDKNPWCGNPHLLPFVLTLPCSRTSDMHPQARTGNKCIRHQQFT